MKLWMAMLAVACAGLPAHADEVAWRFDWQGAGGYAMRGAMAFDAGLLGRDVVTAADLTCFVIEGRRDGAPVGRWALGMLNEETTWALNFSPRDGQFAVFGPDHLMPQAWNMDGFGTDCGPGGFGFNIGNAAQDLCIDGQLAISSQVNPARPFPAVRDDGFEFPPDACIGPALLSALPQNVVPVSLIIKKDAPHEHN